MLKNYENKQQTQGLFIKEQADNNKLASPAPVILGLVPKILLQRVSNLVNKLAGSTKPTPLAPVCNVILRRYSLLEVPWRRIHNVIAKAMSICVAFSNKIMDTRLPQPAGCGDKYDVSGWCCGRGFSAFCTFFKYPSPDAKASPSPARGVGFGLLRRYTPRNDAVTNGEGLHRPWCDKILGTGPSMTGGRGANSFGRSMIEMLGVLAIIGVLSVGGIAGYSKAMEKFKINKTIDEYTMLITGLIEYKNNFIQSSAPQSNIDLDEFIFAAHLVPETWKQYGNKRIRDSNGHDLRIYFSNKSLTEGYTNPGKYVLDLHFSLVKTNAVFSRNLCKTFFIDIGQQMASQMFAMVVIPTSSNTEYAGDAFCHGADKSVTTGQPLKCLRDLTLSEADEICRTCNNNSCGIVFVF